jgi:hypothetical protein
VCVCDSASVFSQNVSKLQAVTETALATMAETSVPATLTQILEEKKLDDPELVRLPSGLRWAFVFALVHSGIRFFADGRRHNVEAISGLELTCVDVSRRGVLWLCGVMASRT